jgi:hypothetical protein
VSTYLPTRRLPGAAHAVAYQIDGVAHEARAVVVERRDHVVQPAMPATGHGTRAVHRKRAHAPTTLHVCRGVRARAGTCRWHAQVRARALGRHEKAAARQRNAQRLRGCAAGHGRGGRRGRGPYQRKYGALALTCRTAFTISSRPAASAAKNCHHSVPPAPWAVGRVWRGRRARSTDARGRRGGRRLLNQGTRL